MRVLMLSSSVAHGHVGLSAGAPALQLLGHNVTVLPTTILSNHPGFEHVSGRPVPVEQLEGMARALDGNGWLSGHDAVLTGYLPTPEHVGFAVSLIERMRQGEAPVVTVDPVLGDEPKGLYLPLSVAEALRERLVPLADRLTPNVFELGWLTGLPVDTVGNVADAARALADEREVQVTSTPVGSDRIGVLRAMQGALSLWSAPRRAGVPHGVGDVYAAFVSAGLPPGRALGHLNVLIEASLGASHLRIAESAQDWTVAEPLPEET